MALGGPLAVDEIGSNLTLGDPQRRVGPGYPTFRTGPAVQCGQIEAKHGVIAVESIDTDGSEIRLIGSCSTRWAKSIAGTAHPRESAWPKGSYPPATRQV